HPGAQAAGPEPGEVLGDCCGSCAGHGKTPRTNNYPRRYDTFGESSRRSAAVAVTPVASAGASLPMTIRAMSWMPVACGLWGPRRIEGQVRKSFETELGYLLSDEPLDVADIVGVLGRDER